MSETKPTPAEGWARPPDSRKFHYFEGNMSLCRRWLYSGEKQADDGERQHRDCAICAKHMEKRRAKGEA